MGFPERALITRAWIPNTRPRRAGPAAPADEAAALPGPRRRGECRKTAPRNGFSH
jgi:hypothetical protein